MSEAEIPQTESGVEESLEPREPAAPIESRFLFVDVAALRAKQLRRGAKLRLPALAVHDAADASGAPTDEVDPGPRPVKAERLAMSEVRHGLVDWTLPDFKAVFDTR